MQFIVFFIKKLVISICILYTFDLIVSSVGVIIPINIITVIFVTFLGLPGLFGLLILENII